MTRTRPSKLVLAVAIALGTTLATAAHAQQQKADTSGQLEDIVITATKRASTVQETAISVTAISGDDILDRGLTDFTALAQSIPGVSMRSSGPGQTEFEMRGMTSAGGNSSTVGFYFGDTPLTAPASAQNGKVVIDPSLYDLSRVEVLRGPQGTLYGSGAVAGTIRIIHNAPDPTRFSAELSADASTTSHAANGSYTLNGMLNIPLSETAALRMNAGYKTIAGFVNADGGIAFGPGAQPELVNPNDPLGSPFKTQSVRDIDFAQSNYARVSLLWHVTPGFDATLAYQRQDDHSNAFSREQEGLAYTDNVLIPNAPDHRIVDLEALTLTGDVGFATITSSTSFARNHDCSNYDESAFLLQFNGSPLYYGNYPRSSTEFITQYTDKSLVEELRLVSKTGNTWDYTVGGFFRHEWNDLFQYETIPGFAAWSALPGSANAVNQVLGSSYANFDDYIQQFNGGTPPSADTPTDGIYTYARNSGFLDRALYGELTFHATPKWQITAGVRAFWQDVSQSVRITIPDGGPLFSTLPPPANLTDAEGTTLNSSVLGFHNHLFKLNSGYEISESLRAYATYSEGFRHGGTNASSIGVCAFCDSPSTASFKPDTVKNYEIGLKGEASGWLRFSGALYRMNWSDIQIQLFDHSSTAYVANGGTATSQGLELELEGKLGHGWSATLGYGYTDAKVTSDFTIVDRGATILSAQDGNLLPYVPKQTLTAGLGYAHPLSDAVVLDLHADASYRSDVSTQINATAAGYQQLGGFTTTDASATFLIASRWRVRFYGNNLTNIQGVSAAGPVLKNADLFPNYRVEYLSRPRTLGLSLAYTFE